MPERNNIQKLGKTNQTPQIGKKTHKTFEIGLNFCVYVRLTDTHGFEKKRYDYGVLIIRKNSR